MRKRTLAVGRRLPSRLLTLMLLPGLLTLAAVLPADAQDQAEPVDRQQRADQTEGLGVTGPQTAAVGDIIDVVIEVPDEAAAYETVLDFDGSALDFGGLYPADEQEVSAIAANLQHRVAAAGYRCTDEHCNDGLSTGLGPVTARFAVAAPGRHRIRLHRTLLASTVGGTTAVPDAVIEVVVGGGEATTTGATATALNAPAAGEAAAPADLTGEGAVNGLDVAEVHLTWEEVRRRGAPCELTSQRLRAVDVDRNGCIDIADLATVAAAAAAEPDIARRDGNAESGEAAVAPMVVTNTSDEWDANLNNGVCNTPSGGCSLRAAILQANANPGPDIIHFNIPGAGPHRITLGDRLPTINDTTGSLTIDGYTQPGASPNTLERLSNANLKIEIYGTGYSNGNVSLVISSSGNTIRGLAIYRAFWNMQLTGAGATENRIIGNFIGTDASAGHETTSATTDQAGIEIASRASRNRIGTPLPADRNVISGNPYSGIRINHAGTKGNIIQNNLVGLRPDGNDSLYTLVAGIDAQWGAEETVIGGYQRLAGNVVTGNRNYGIDLSHSSKNNRVVGNFIGTDATGSRVLSHTPNLIGLAIKDNTVGNLIEYNVIGGNTRDGVWHRHNFTGANTFRHNRIGVGVDGSNVGNARFGIYLTGHDDTYQGNLIANNGDRGIFISNYNGGNGFSPPQYTERNEITGNSFHDNGSAAIDISGAHNNIAAPSITSSSSGSAAGSACGGCRVELYAADGNQGRQLIASTTAASNGAWSISNNRIDDVQLVALAIGPNDDTSEFGNTRSVGSVTNNATPTIAAIADRGGLRYQWITFSVSAADGDGNPLTYSAIGLPAGVSIDLWSGRISGRPGSVGDHEVTVRVDDGGRVAQRSFRWTVSAQNQAPTVDRPDREQTIDDFESDRGWTVNPSGGDGATTGIWEIGDMEASPLSDGVRYQLGSTPSGVGALVTGKLAGSSAGTHDIDGGVTTVRSPAIELSSSATELRFQYYFAHSSNADSNDFFRATIVAADGSRTEVLNNRGSAASVAASWRQATIDVSAFASRTVRLEFAAADAGGASLVEAAVDDLQLVAGELRGTVGDQVTLPIRGSDPEGAPLSFSASGLPGGLSINSAGLISGTLNQQGTFNVLVTATDPEGLSGSVGFPWTVEGGGGGAFTCSVDGNTLNWTDDGAARYYIRQNLNGSDRYLGTTTGLSLGLTSPAGTYTVIHWIGGTKVQTSCDGPAGAAFSCTVSGNILSWTDDGASRYFIRQNLNGNDTYLGSSTTLNFTLTNPTGSYTVIHWVGGTRLSTDCRA